MGDNDGFELLKRARSYGYDGKVIFISANENDFYIESAHRLDVDGYVSKSEGLDFIKDSIVSVINGYKVFKNIVKKSTVSLSRREVVVLNLLAKGKTNVEISKILSLSNKTVSTYKRRILSKYKVKSVIELLNILGIAVK